MFQILVVENDHELRELFCTVLSDNSYNAIEAADRQQTLDVLYNTNHRRHYDVRMDGIAMTCALWDSGYQIPILNCRQGKSYGQAGGFPGRHGR